jgi:hypothetical protein
VHGAAAWVTVTVLPATVARPVRALVDVFAAIFSVTAPVPDPLVVDRPIHDVLVVAVQSQPPGVYTVTVCAVSLRLTESNEALIE